MNDESGMADRRAVLRGLAGTLALIAWPGAGEAAQAAGSLSTQQFTALSSALTGVSSLDPSDVAAIQAAFSTPARRADLAKLAQIVASKPASDLPQAVQAARLESLANDLVAAWYSGVVTTASGARVVLYVDALVWSAMTFSKPMGVCGGPTGYWANPPQ